MNKLLVRDDKHKTAVDKDRLAWWGEKADPAFWHGTFSQMIRQQHRDVAAANVPNYIQPLFKYLPRKGKIIEAGCGTGWIVAALLARGYEVEGVDSSGQLIEEVLQLYPRLPVRIDDVLCLNCDNESYAGYLSFGVIEHRQEGSEPFLEEAYRVLQPGGIGIISVPHFNALRLLKANLHLYATAPPETSEFYQYAFTKAFFSKLLTDVGFDLISYYTYGAYGCLFEELRPAYEKLKRTRLLWRLLKYLRYADKFDRTQLVSHMIMAIVQKPV